MSSKFKVMLSVIAVILTDTALLTDLKSHRTTIELILILLMNTSAIILILKQKFDESNPN
jgi:ABC-type glycerol-3-phosphate transport system permease component